MGVPVRIVMHTAEQDADAAAAAAFERIASLDRMMSDYRPDSEVRGLGTGEWTPVSDELFATIARAIDIARATGGAFDPSVGPLVGLWREARTTRRLPDRATLAAARARVGWRKIQLDPSRHAVRTPPDMRLDLGGIAKGYIVSEALGVLRARGITRALVEAGGDIVVGDAPPGQSGWRIDAPGADAAFRRRANALTNAALATSGPTAQYVEIDGVRYSHVIDPRTGAGVTNAFVARVIHQDASTADALATALTILGPARMKEIRRHFPGAVVSISAPGYGSATYGARKLRADSVSSR